MKIRKIAILLALMIVTSTVPLWASVGEDTRDYIATISQVNVSSTSAGSINITIPGHGDADVMAFATDYDLEFFVTPPEGARFSTITNLGVTGNVNVTFGPVVRSCGRLFFIVTANNTGNETTQEQENATVDIIFYPGNGSLPYGESGSEHGPVGMLVNHAPAPIPPHGHIFAGWQHNGVPVSIPFHAAASMTLEAIYEPAPAGDAAGTTFTLTLRPSGGILPPGEPHSRALPVNSTVNELPTPTREGHDFSGWMNGSEVAALPVVVTANTELTAAWARQSDTQTTAQTAATATNTAPQLYAAIFNPYPGAFLGNETGLRSGAYGTVISDIPVPTLSGYIFVDWRLPNSQPLDENNITLTGDINLSAIWVASSIPASPNPSSTPTPAPGNTATLPNPQTSPIQISFMIFGTIIIAGIAILSITKLSRKQLAAADEYRAKVARYNREKRIMDLLDDKN